MSFRLGILLLVTITVPNVLMQQVGIGYHAQPDSQVKQPVVYYDTLNVDSMQQCLDSTFYSGASIARYTPPVGPNQATCDIYFGDDVIGCPGDQKAGSEEDTIYEATVISCLTCGALILKTTTQQPACHKQLYFYAAPLTSANTPIYYDQDNASSAEECATKCFLRGCQAAAYTPGQSPYNCGFTFDTIYSKCSGQQETNQLTTTSQALLFTCIGCDCVDLTTTTATTTTTTTQTTTTSPTTAPTSTTTTTAPTTTSNPTTTTAIPTTIVPTTTTVALTTPSSSTCSQTISFIEEIPKGRFSGFDTQVDANSAAECAKACYERKCTQAGWVPAAPTCLLSFTVPSQCSQGTFVTSSQQSGSASTIITCVKCAAIPTTIVPTTTTVALTTPSSSTCSQTISFIEEKPKGRFSGFDTQVDANSAAECAKACYERKCTQAGWVPAAPTCLLSFTVPSQCSQGTFVTSSQESGSASTIITCVKCAAIPTTTVPTTTTVALTTPSSPTCSQTISFIEEIPKGRFSGFDTQVDANSAAECAKACYERKCTQAGWVPAAPTCLLSFTVPSQCSQGTFVTSSQQSGSASTIITCVKCGVDSKKLPRLPTCQGTLEFVAESQSALSGNEYAQPAHSVEECAAICYAANCQQAAYLPSSSECGISHCTKKKECSGTFVTSFSGYGGTAIKCVRCRAATTTALTITVPPTTTARGVDLFNLLRPCAGTIIFVAQSQSESSLSGYEYAQPAHSVEECAAACYAVQCQQAAYLPSSAECAISHCTKKAFCSGTYVSSFSGTGAAAITCVKCTAATPTTIVPTTTTVALTTPSSPTCSQTISFIEEIPKGRFSGFDTQVDANSAAECAKACYERKCTQAGWVPAAPTCLLSFTVPSQCSQGTFVTSSQQSGSASTIITCVKCGDDPNKTTSKSCQKTLKFNTHQPTGHFKSDKEVEADSAEECADHCYKEKCTQAAYSAIIGACLLSLKAPADCSGTSASNTNQGGTVIITCVTCQ